MSPTSFSSLRAVPKASAPSRPTRPPMRYRPLAVWLHWATAILILVLMTTGVTMKQLGEGEWANDLTLLHKTVGPIALMLILARLAYRIGARLSGRWRSELGSHPLHRLLYGIAIVVPLLGWAGVSDFDARGILFGLELPPIWPKDAGYADALFTMHIYLAFALIGIVLLHIGVALGDHIHGARRVHSDGLSSQPGQQESD